MLAFLSFSPWGSVAERLCCVDKFGYGEEGRVPQRLISSVMPVCKSCDKQQRRNVNVNTVKGYMLSCGV